MNSPETQATPISNSNSRDPATEQHISNDTITIDRRFYQELMDRAISNNPYCTSFQPYSSFATCSSYLDEDCTQYRPTYDSDTRSWIYEPLKETVENQIKESLKKEPLMTKEEILGNLPADILSAYHFVMAKKAEYLGSLNYDYFTDGITPDSTIEHHFPVDYIKKMIHSIIPDNIWNFYLLHNRKFKSLKSSDMIYDTDLKFWDSDISDCVSCYKKDSDLEEVNTEYVFNLRFNIKHDMGSFINRDANLSNQLKLVPNRFYLSLCFERGSRTNSNQTNDFVKRLGIYESIRMTIKSIHSSYFIIRFLYVDPRSEWNRKFQDVHPILFHRLDNETIFTSLPNDMYNTSSTGSYDVGFYYDKDSRIIDIVSNKPLFTIEQLKLLTNIFKLFTSKSSVSNGYDEYCFHDANNIMIQRSEEGLYSIKKMIPKSNQTLLWLQQIVLRDLWLDPNSSVQKLLKLISDSSNRNCPKKVITKNELNNVKASETYETYHQHPFWKGLPKLEIRNDNVTTIDDPNDSVPLEAWAVDYTGCEILDSGNEETGMLNTKFDLTNKLNNLKLPVDLTNQPWFVTIFNSFSYLEHLRNFYQRSSDADHYQQLVSRIIPLRIEDYIDEMNLKYDSLLKQTTNS